MLHMQCTGNGLHLSEADFFRLVSFSLLQFLSNTRNQVQSCRQRVTHLVTNQLIHKQYVLSFHSNTALCIV